MVSRSILLMCAALTAACATSVADDSKETEAQLLSEISAISEASRQRITTEEARNSTRRLGELRLHYPEKQVELAQEARQVRELFVASLEDERRISAKLNELSFLPISQEYRNCVNLQIEQSNVSANRYEATIDEMNALIDPTIANEKERDVKVLLSQTKIQALGENLKIIQDKLSRSVPGRKASVPICKHLQIRNTACLSLSLCVVTLQYKVLDRLGDFSYASL
jgi:hypothetical protein